jgi:hypothetical protein
MPVIKIHDRPIYTPLRETCQFGSTGGGAQVFLAIPVLATIGTVLVARYESRASQKTAL